MNAWQPIETAPINERVFLWCPDLFSAGKVVGIVFGALWSYHDLPPNPKGEGMNGDWKFTHWMPLPEPPL